MELVDSSSSANNPLCELSVGELGERIVDYAGRLAAGMCRWLLLVAEFEVRQGYLSFGLASTAQWLTHACGIAHRTAVEHVRVARSLRQHPRLAEEMGAGRLSYSQVRVITRIASPGVNGLVEELIEAARHATVAQIEVVVRGLRTVDHNEQATDPGEYLKQSWTSDSRWHLSARLDPERGAVVGAAIEAIMARDGCSPTEALERLAEIGLASLADEQNPPRELRGDERAAVVIHLDAARVPPRSADPSDTPLPRSAQHDANEVPVPRSAERDPSDTATPRSVERDPDDASVPRSPQHDPDQVPSPRSAERDPDDASVRRSPQHDPDKVPSPRSAERDPDDASVRRSPQHDPDKVPSPRSAERDPDAAPLSRSAERDGEQVSIVARPYARIAGGPGLPDRVVQRLICEGRIRTVIHDGVIHDGASNVLDVGRSHRLVTDRQYRALLLRQHGHCAHPGCPNTRNLHAHHRIHWIHGGRTDLLNLLLLCERHHVGHHAGDFEIVTTGPGRFRFISSDGRDLSAPIRSSASPKTIPLEDEHADVAADAATPLWDGQRLDRSYAISVLAQRRQVAS